MAGVFFTFSTFVMKALERLPASEGIAAMQSINVFAVRSWFLVAFLGTAIACLALGVWSLWHLDQHPARWVLAGTVFYLVGGLLVTIAANVPMNDALATLDPAAPASAAKWSAYLADWTRWNHVRTLACLAASALLTLALVGSRNTDF
jgi:uncharacterized membrane protein